MLVIKTVTKKTSEQGDIDVAKGVQWFVDYKLPYSGIISIEI